MFLQNVIELIANNIVFTVPLAMLRRCWYWRYQKTLSGQFPGCLLGAMLSGTGRMGRAMMGMEVSAR